ncbi:hypothetical protein PQQ86_03455 [Paraburkholderia sediminicola]|uniref:hypothetical protein n=1 Tax=Paraburkholderia sediminicola TaxID=458836 RepID=UPI0038B7AF02
MITPNVKHKKCVKTLNICRVLSIEARLKIYNDSPPARFTGNHRTQPVAQRAEREGHIEAGAMA